jgi:PAS domain S-box-containing protein
MLNAIEEPDRRDNMPSRHALRTALDEKQAVETSLRRSENYLAQAQQLSRTGSFGWTPSTGEVHWSDETFRIYELDRNIKPTIELALQRIHPDDRALVRQAIDKTSRGEKEFDLTHRLLLADGSVKYVQVSSRTVKDAAGNLEVVGALMDVTERKVQEQAQARLAAIVSSSDAAIVGKTLDGVVTSWNAGAESIFGYKAHEMIGQSINRIIPPELQKEEKEILRRIQQGDRIKNYHTVRNCKDGRRIDISLTISPVLDQSSNVVGASKIARDITAEKRAEEELQQIRAELARVARLSTVGELTAAIAHELNQPLVGVVNSGNACLRWLSREPPDILAARKSSERVIAAGERAAQVIKRVRSLVDKAPPQREQFNINDAISEVLALIPGEIQRNSISLRTHFTNDLPFILADRIQLQQVILNLVLNAVEAMRGVPSPRDLLVASAKSESDDGVLVTVRDSGTGLDEKSLDRLFEPFYTTKAEGMGIGLAISQTIIQTHGGLLWARPNSPRGAVFAFSVPAKSEQVS